MAGVLSWSVQLNSTQMEEFFAKDGKLYRVVYTMCITTRNGKKIRRPNGRPFRFVVEVK